jgi:hypothetical protein
MTDIRRQIGQDSQNGRINRIFSMPIQQPAYLPSFQKPRHPNSVHLGILLILSKSGAMIWQTSAGRLGACEKLWMVLSDML